MKRDETNRGAIWRNDKKTTDKHPDYTGQANVEGVDYWVSAWKRDPNANPSAPALRFSFKQKDGKESRPAKEAAGIKVEPYRDDEIPF